MYRGVMMTLHILSIAVSLTGTVGSYFGSGTSPLVLSMEVKAPPAPAVAIPTPVAPPLPALPLPASIGEALYGVPRLCIS